MESLLHVASIAQVIQLAVAPVFLLTGVGAMLNVLASRIGRIIDRARVLEAELARTTADADDTHRRLAVLSRRARWINRAIGLCVFSGILVSVVVVSLFMSAAFKIDVALPIAVAFVMALLCLAAALIYFLREVFLATESLRFGGARPS